MHTDPTPLTGGPLPAAGGVTVEEFKAVFRHHPAGVAVITLRTPTGPVGLTATSVISVSADPPLLAFSLASTSSSRPALEAAQSLVVNFLAADQSDVAARFARRGVDRFEGVDWCPLPTGEPVLRGTTAWVRGRIAHRFPVGDSLLITVHADLAHRADDPEPLVYVDRTYHRLG
ncbi:flavin reductase family protein [Georgenia sunbinii]|uniref:flavin reductase family protein n=1 Tax=Georgenia sunbinii TaxID=3117728 RepID=UPI002F260D1B